MACQNYNFILINIKNILKMNNFIAQRDASRENQSLMIYTMEKKLNGGSFAWFKYFNRRDQNLSRISVA